MMLVLTYRVYDLLASKILFIKQFKQAQDGQ